MNNLDEMYRKTLEEEADMLGTPDHCTINRAMELITSAYTMGYQQSSEQELRERYAGMAMQAFIINGFSENSLPKDPDEARHYLAMSCIKMADALIKELRKEE